LIDEKGNIKRAEDWKRISLHLAFLSLDELSLSLPLSLSPSLSLSLNPAFLPTASASYPLSPPLHLLTSTTVFSLLTSLTYTLHSTLLRFLIAMATITLSINHPDDAASDSNCDCGIYHPPSNPPLPLTSPLPSQFPASEAFPIPTSPGGNKQEPNATMEIHHDTHSTPTQVNLNNHHNASSIEDSDDDILDLLVIGAGPHSLSLLCYLFEKSPFAIMTDDSHQRLHHRLKTTNNNTPKQPSSTGGSSNKTAQSASKGFWECCSVLDSEALKRRIMVIDGVGEWMGKWNKSFEAYGIEHLRSPMFFHPDS
jgi:hypothetical protein